jgi:mono/diheme cytochrome c family protein
MRKTIPILSLLMAVTAASARGQNLGAKEFAADCARCHGADGKGDVPAMRAVPGYLRVDLTQLAKDNGGEFPQQKVFDTIDGRDRIQAHFSGDMPRWGSQYQLESRDPANVKRRIEAMVAYIKSLQEK